MRDVSLSFSSLSMFCFVFVFFVPDVKGAPFFRFFFCFLFFCLVIPLLLFFFFFFVVQLFSSPSAATTVVVRGYDYPFALLNRASIHRWHRTCSHLAWRRSCKEPHSLVGEALHTCQAPWLELDVRPSVFLKGFLCIVGVETDCFIVRLSKIVKQSTKNSTYVSRVLPFTSISSITTSLGVVLADHLLLWRKVGRAWSTSSLSSLSTSASGIGWSHW